MRSSSTSRRRLGHSRDSRQTTPGIPSMAVLPFVNLGPDQGLEYFCNGLAEELLTALGKVQGLRVASRTSSFGVKQTDTDIRSICRQLDVDAVLEGTVRKAGDRLRITAQLVSAEDGCHLWSEGYDREMADVFAVQEEIAQNVVDRLKVSADSKCRRSRLIRRYTDNPRAYHLYLKGRFYWLRRYHGGLQAALEHFQQAIEEDAGYALAHAGVADAYAMIGFYSLQKPRLAFANAAAAAERALAIDPDLPEAHTSLALVNLGDWDWPEAERQFTRALELDPSQAMARIYWSWLMVLQGDSAGAMHPGPNGAGDGTAVARSSMAAWPTHSTWRGGMTRRSQNARRVSRSIPTSSSAFTSWACAARCRDGLPTRSTIGERAVSMSGRAPFYLGVLGHYYARSGATDKVREIVEELERLAGQRYVPPHCFAYIHAGLNEIDRALDWEARAYDDGASPFNYYSPLIENLHADPRHIAELRRMRVARVGEGTLTSHRVRIVSHHFIVDVTRSAASCWTKCPAPGIVTSVRSFSSQSQVPARPLRCNAWSPSPWNISTGILTLGSGGDAGRSAPDPSG